MDQKFEGFLPSAIGQINVAQTFGFWRGWGGGSPLNLQSNEVTEDRVANKDYSLEVRVQGY